MTSPISTDAAVPVPSSVLPDTVVLVETIDDEGASTFNEVTIPGHVRDAALKSWSEELRTEGLPQTTGTLASREGECCLGVFSRVLRDKHPEVLSALNVEVFDMHADDGIVIHREIVSKRDSHGGGPGVSSVLPDRLEDAFIPQGDGRNPEVGFYIANDSHKQTFSQIADAVDAYRFGNAETAMDLLMRDMGRDALTAGS